MIMREMRSSFTETMASISHEPSLEYETQAHYGSDVEGCSKLKARRCLLHTPEACSSTSSKTLARYNLARRCALHCTTHRQTKAWRPRRAWNIPRTVRRAACASAGAPPCWPSLCPTGNRSPSLCPKLEDDPPGHTAPRVRMDKGVVRGRW